LEEYFMNRKYTHKAILSAVAASAIVGASYLGIRSGHNVYAETAVPTPTPKVEAVAPVVDLSRGFRAVHEAMKDAVVNINVAKRSGMSGNTRMMIPDELRGMLPPGLEQQLRQMPDRMTQGTGSGVIGQPVTYRGPDGHQYVAVMSGVGGWAGAVVVANLDPRDQTAALGFVNATADLKDQTQPGGTLSVFALPH
jgi:hypothetical protein